MRRSDMGVLIAYIREHSESSAIDDALDALAAAAREMPTAGLAIGARAVNNLHSHLIESGDAIGAGIIEALTFEDVTA